MEATKEKWFELIYNTKSKKMSLRKPRLTNQMRKKKIMKILKEHIFLITVGITFIIFSTLNSIMIFTFLDILQNF